MHHRNPNREDQSVDIKSEIFQHTKPICSQSPPQMSDLTSASEFQMLNLSRVLGSSKRDIYDWLEENDHCAKCHQPQIF